MEVLFVLIPVSIGLAAASVVACLAAIRGGQYDDLESPRWRMLFDDRRAPEGPAAEKGETMKRETPHTGAAAPRSTPL